MSHVRTVSSGKSCKIFLPTTISVYWGEIPVPGLLAITSLSEINSPFFISLVKTNERLASLLGTNSQSKTVFSADPRIESINLKFAIAFLKSSGSPAW